MRIGIGSGHRKSVILAFAEGGRLDELGGRLYIQTGPALNIHCLDEEDGRLSDRLQKILTSLQQSLPQPRRESGFRPEDRLALSLPGVSTYWDQDVGENCVAGSDWPRANPPNFCVVDDTFAGLIAGALSTRGICAFAGTGASVYMGTPDGASGSYVVGPPDKWDGFGPLLGDHGSAFRMAVTTLERICCDLNECVMTDRPTEGRGRHGLPVLFDKLIRKIRKNFQQGDEARSVLQYWIDGLLANRKPDWRFQIAELAKVITEAAETGDRFAQAMVDEAAAGIVRTLCSALNHEDFAEMHSVPIYCQGGMFRHSPFYLQRVTDLLRKDGKNNLVELARYRPCVGALLIAASPDWNVPHDEGINAILKAIDSIPHHDRHLVFNRP